jgi:hypothetical protein
MLTCLNRLGDLHLILARAANREDADTLWTPGLSLRPEARAEAERADGDDR